MRQITAGRKACFGSQSEVGLRFVEQILTVATTPKRQGRDLIEFVAQALKAKSFGLPAPSLILV